MLKMFLFVLGLLLPMVVGAEGYLWTGNGGNNDFFDELNWQNPVSDEIPPNGAIDAGVRIDLSLVIRDASQTVVANGDISMGSGSLSIEGASLNGTTFSDGDLNINEQGYVLLSGTNPIGTTAKIDFTGGLGWVKMPETTPVNVLNNHLPSFLIAGTAAVYPDNIRIDNYYEGGALVRPNLSSATPMVIFDEPALQGNHSFVEVDAVHSGSAIPGNLNNEIASFELKRGYMATLAINDDGTGLSKVFIASEEDLVVEELPLNLNKKASFIRVVPWNWVAKKGIGGNVTGLNETWHYNWANTGVSTIERENVPMSWGKGGADDASDIELYKGKYKTPHVLAFNESDNCDDQSGQWGDLCNTDVAVATYQNLMKTGLRLVSPSCRENAPFGWLKEFYDKATAQDIRIDVIGVHWYDWGSNPKNSPNADPQQVFNRFKNYLQRVYDLYQRPIWITEFNANINRTTAVNKAFMKLALPYLESLDYVERYAWFEPFSDVADYYDGSGNYTEVGLVYKNHESTPSVPVPSYLGSSNLDDALILGDNARIVTNGDFETGDLTGWKNHADNGLVQSADEMNDPSHLIDGEYSYFKNWGTGDMISQVIEVEAGEEYTLSYETYLAWDWIYLYARIYDIDTDELIAETDVHMKDPNTGSVGFTAPAGGSVRILFHKWADSPGRAGIDNVLVELKTATPISNVKADDIKVAKVATGEFVVSGAVEISSLSVFASGGQLVKKMASKGTSEVTFNLNGQPQGLYIIRIVDVQGNVSVKKVINN